LNRKIIFAFCDVRLRDGNRNVVKKTTEFELITAIRFLGYNAQSVGNRNPNSRRNVLSSTGGDPITPCNSSVS